MSHEQEQRKALQTVLEKSLDNKRIFGTSFGLKTTSLTWYGASGDISIDQPFFIASTTKLFTTAIILNLKSRGTISLDDRIDKYLDASILGRLHSYKRVDYSNEITIKQLLAHTSGLPDYFRNRGDNGRSLEQDIVSGNDQDWTFEQAIEKTKALKPLFAPGTRDKAHYSDSNFQLLGKIIETVTAQSYAHNCSTLIASPLGLRRTYLYQDSRDTEPKTLYYKSKELMIPRAMTSFGADGGLVSTSADMLVFIESFFTGRLFPIEYLNDLQEWNKIFFPMQAGIGIVKFKLPWIFNPTGAGVAPYFIGHSGLSGALAFYNPKGNLFVVGTVNQVAFPHLSFRTMMQLTQIALKK